MWTNVGAKLKTLAKVVCWLGIILSVIMGIMMIATGNQVSYNGAAVGGVVGGITTIIVGSLASWLGSLTTYAIGEAAEYAEKH
ncbi:MAG: hypothetical protein IKH77_09855 [Clostridia bacterium]|nr:hypothetical protein [Clostridia bacterium]